MSGQRIRLFSGEELQRQIFEALNNNPFLPLPIAEGAEVRVRGEGDGPTGVVREYRASGHYAVELADGTVVVVGRAELERDNPHAPRARRGG